MARMVTEPTLPNFLQGRVYWGLPKLTVSVDKRPEPHGGEALPRAVARHAVETMKDDTYYALLAYMIPRAKVAATEVAAAPVEAVAAAAEAIAVPWEAMAAVGAADEIVVAADEIDEVDFFVEIAEKDGTEMIVVD